MLFEVLYTFVLDGEVKRPGMHVDIDDYDIGMRLLETRVGIRLTPHQFRHLAARLLLRGAPGAFGAAHQLLGHKHMKTTTGFYAGIDTLTAGRQYDEILQATRAQLRGPVRRRR
jgi:integrase